MKNILQIILGLLHHLPNRHGEEPKATWPSRICGLLPASQARGRNDNWMGYGRILLLGCVLVLLDCGEGNQSPQQNNSATSCTPTDTTTPPPPGFVCIGTSWAVMSAGRCQTDTDCVPPYQSCETSAHQCQSPTIARCLSDTDCPSNLPTCDTGTRRCRSSGGSITLKAQTWFVTDNIRPAATVDCVDKDHCAALNRYVYNIMAKGYNSLEDWCLAQAQQSNLPAMRDINSWRALIAAQPDGGYGNESRQLYLTLTDFSLLLGTSPSAKYRSPGDTSTFSKSHAQIADKNGLVSFFQDNPAGDLTYGAWTGMAVLQNLIELPGFYPSSCPFYGSGLAMDWHRCPVPSSLSIGTGVGNIDVTSKVLGEQFIYSSTSSPRWTASQNAWSTVYDPVFTSTDTSNNPTLRTDYYHSFAGILILTPDPGIASPFYFVTATAKNLPRCDTFLDPTDSVNCPCYYPLTAPSQIYVPTGSFTPKCQVPDRVRPYAGPGIQYYANATTSHAYPIICLANQNN